MTDAVITALQLGKKYRLGAKQERYPTLRDALSGLTQVPGRLIRRSLANSGGRTGLEFWALRNVSFEVERGDVLGIIGRNGAGKSTLLKLFSRITDPTEGEIRMRGRVASLLEVGTGFHPELTGRENVLLNGAILGMSKSETLRKFDEIVAFAEIDEFIDTQVKRYSSGMYMRLAFSVAAHLEPEVLIVDEVLAVGDVAFQKKCLGKMDEVSAGGRTVLFVSHNLAAIRTLCHSAVLLERGSVVESGPVDRIMQLYELRVLARTDQFQEGVVYVCPEDLRNGTCYVETVEVLGDTGERLSAIHTWDRVRLRLWYQASKRVSPGAVNLWVKTLDGVSIILWSTSPDSNVALDLQPGRHFVDCIVNQLPISAGKYIFGVGLSEPGVKWLFRDENTAILTVLAADVFDSGQPPTVERALVSTPHKWFVGT